MSQTGLSQEDIDEMQLCVNDCQEKVSQEKEAIKKCTNLTSLKKFFIHTLPGNLLIIMIIYFLVQQILKKVD